MRSEVLFFLIGMTVIVGLGLPTIVDDWGSPQAKAMMIFFAFLIILGLLMFTIDAVYRIVSRWLGKK